MDLIVNERAVESQVVVDVRGEVDVHTAARLRDRLIAALDGGTHTLIVDLTQLGFIDSTGLGALVAARNHADQVHASLRLVCSSERLLKLFRITGLHEVFSIYPTMEDAMASAELPPPGA